MDTLRDASNKSVGYSGLFCRDWLSGISFSVFSVPLWFIALVLVAALGLFQPMPAVAQPPAFDRKALIDSYSAHVRPKGTWEWVDWPNTLDLAERGRLGVQALTGNLDPANSYAPYS